MSAAIVHVNAAITCLHGGQVSAITSNSRVFVSGQPVVTQNDTFSVAGCTFVTVSNKPQPCVIIKWSVPATRILVNGQLAILQNSVGLGLSAEQAPQGPPNVIATQVRVKAM